MKGVAWLVALPLAVVGLIGLVEVEWAWWIIALLWAPTGLLVLASADVFSELGGGGDGSSSAGTESRDDDRGGGGADATA